MDKKITSLKYISNVGVSFSDGVYKLHAFDGESSLTLELDRRQAINLYDELNDLIDLDLKINKKPFRVFRDFKP